MSISGWSPLTSHRFDICFGLNSDGSFRWKADMPRWPVVSETP